MRKNGFLFAKVAGFFIAAALLAGCYAPLANQNGYLSLNLKFGAGAKAGTNEIIGLVVNDDYRNEFKEMLYLIDKGQEDTSLNGTDTDRLVELGKLMATSALVKFGGFPFFQTTIDPSGGNFELSGLPAGRSYLVKLYVFPAGFSFSVDDIGEDFGALIQSENRVFSNNEDYPTAYQSWVPVAGQPVEVTAGETATVSVTFSPRTP